MPMPFPLSLDGKLEVKSCMKGEVKPENLHDIIVSSLKRIQGCSVHSNNLKILFSCDWRTLFRRGWTVAYGFSNGEISLSSEGTALIINYKVMIRQGLIFDVVMGGLFLLAIRKNYNDSVSPAASIGFLSIGLLWCLLYIGEYILMSFRFRRFLKRRVREAGDQSGRGI
jgi:hypothetical protein